ncbi:MAG TPA: DapH/DapD/GlmU-related protein [Burkholderiaceae bacterium]
MRIGTGSFIGTHTVILPNVSIGRHCVIGAGSVVTSDIPDNSIAVGVPARVISTYKNSIDAWIRPEA